MAIFNRTDTARVGFSAFDLSYNKLLTADQGYLYPIMCDEAVPGDRWIISFESICRMNPSIAPVLHEMNMRVNYFFCPYRLLWDDFEEFITGGEDGTSAPTVPTWAPTNVATGSLWDYMFGCQGLTPDADNRPVDYPRRAYNRIFNQFYRPEEIYAEIAETGEVILETTWEKDYFGAAQTSQQRGVPPGIPVNGTLDIDGKDGTITVRTAADATSRDIELWTDEKLTVTGAVGTGSKMWWIDPQLEVDLTSGATIDIAEVRLALRIQEWMERNQRAGARYFEFLQSHFRVGGDLDSRLDRMEFIGGAKSPIIVSEVLQTSETNTTPQGTLAGHGINVDQNFIGKYRVKEFGLIMGIMSIMPKAAYDTNGMNRQWFKTTNKDHYFPEFANLSEQAILVRELTLSGVKADNESVFGYIGAWDHMRTKMSMVCGQMSGSAGTSFDYWHMARQYVASSGTSINWTYLKGGANVRKDWLAAPSEPAFFINFGNNLKVIRPMPVVSIPSTLGA